VRATKRVLGKCPVAKIDLVEHMERLSQRNAMSDAVTLGYNKKLAKQSTDGVKLNMTRITDAIALSEDAMRVTDDHRKKIKNAIMW